MIDFDKLKKVPVKTWYLQFIGQVTKPDDALNIVLWDKPDITEYLKLYNAVGQEWGWTGNLLMPASELLKKLHSDSNEVWLLKDNEMVVGFFEIDFLTQGKSEIVYLGLLPQFIGKGYGKSLLNAAIFKAAKGGRRVWLHTCEHDHENALAVYQKAGFKIISESIADELYPVEFLKMRGIQ